MIRWVLPPGLVGDVHSIVGYREDGRALHGAMEMASLVVPLIIGFGAPFRIALGRPPVSDDSYGSFTSGLYPGFVVIDSTGAAECIQIDFTPLGAFRFFGLPMWEISNCMVRLDELADRGLEELRWRLEDEPDWERRFALVEAFLLERLGRGTGASAAVAWAYAAIAGQPGRVRVRDIAATLGWSRKRLNDRFREEVGVGPKALARMARFNHALEFAITEPDQGWAGIAADCGYADQAHLVREFREFAGMPPTEIARSGA